MKLSKKLAANLKDAKKQKVAERLDRIDCMVKLICRDIETWRTK